jgi:Uncharacterized conserved protein
MSPRTISIPLPVPGSRAGWLATGLALGMLGAVLAGPLLSTRPILAADPTATPEHTISVSGTGRIVLSPDTADLRLGVSATAKTVKAARSLAATSMTAVIASLKKLGIAEADIQTTTLSLQPVYDYSYNTNPPRLTGYQLSNAVAVTIRDLDKLGDAIDNALAAGATSLDGVSFRVADQTAAEQQARQAAITEAKAKAKTLADAAGISISGVASISETVAPVPYPVYYGFNAAGAPGAKDVQTPVAPGSTEVTVTVAVVYLIG